MSGDGLTPGTDPRPGYPRATLCLHRRNADTCPLCQEWPWLPAPRDGWHYTPSRCDCGMTREQHRKHANPGHEFVPGQVRDRPPESRVTR